MSSQQGDGTPATAVADDISRAEMLPFLISFRDLRRRAFLWPAVTTATFVTALLLLAAMKDQEAFLWTLASYITLANLYLVFLWCGKKQPFFYILLITVFAFLLDAVLLDLIVLVERALPTAFAPGLVEEAVKALPLGVVFAIGSFLSHDRQRKYGLREPLDGILLAAASATGFAYLETMFVYVPHFGALISIPRLLVNVFGHIAYAGAFGYFIGLAALHRHNRRKALIAILVGFLIANVLHDLWDAIRFYPRILAILSPVHEVFIAVVSFLVLGSAILKGREVSPEREFLWPFGSVAAYRAPEVDPLPPMPVITGDFWLQIGSVRTRLASDTTVSVREIGCLEPRSSDGVVAEILHHPTEPDLLVLRNLSKNVWEAVLPDGAVRAIEPAGTVRVIAGTRLDFGELAGAILVTVHDPEKDPVPEAEAEWC